MQRITLNTSIHYTLHIYTPVCFALFFFFFFFFALFPIQGLCQFGSRSPSPRQNMSHKSEHVGHWEDLETWLSVATVSLLPKAAETLKHQTQDQLDDNITSLMGQDPSQSYSHKELAKITGSLSHTLIAILGDGGVEKACLVDVLHLCQVEPEMALLDHHGGHRLPEGPRRDFRRS